MKNFTKICLIFALCFGGLGAVFCITAYAMGADFETLSVWYDAEAHRFYTEDEETVNTDFEEHFSDIEELDLDIGQANMTILYGDSDDFVVRASKVSSRFTCKKDGRKLKIKEDGKKNALGIDFSGLKKTSMIALEVPKDTVLRKIDVEVGVGELDIQGIHVEELEGECGVGTLAFSGTVDGDCSLECGVGDMSLELTGSAEDFNYELECGIGEINLGGSSFSGLGHERKIQNNAGKKMSLECGVGEIRVTFLGDNAVFSDQEAMGLSIDAEEEHQAEEERKREEYDKKREEYERKKEEYEQKAAEYEELLDELDEIE